MTTGSCSKDLSCLTILLIRLHRTFLLSINKYFETTLDDQDPVPFRTILDGLLRTWYPADTMLPVGADYRTYPFLVFRSFNLEEIRHRIFSGNSVFASYEMNVLNMLLSTQSSD